MSVISGSASINNSALVRATLKVERDVEWVSSSTAVKPDMKWELVDAAGHFHAFGTGDGDEQLPTLRARRVHVNCDGSCGGVCEGEGYDVTRYSCRICNEDVEPAWVPDRAAIAIPGLWRWEVEAEGPEWVNGLVTVRLVLDSGEFFGVAGPAGMTFRGDRLTVRLVGAGPLGRRTIPPKCTCPLIDVSVSPQNPSFVLGDSKGCKVHGQARDAAIEAAKRAARGEPVDPFAAASP